MSDVQALIEATRQNLERCLREHDREDAVRSVLAAVDGGLAVEDLYTSVLQPFLASVGSEWQQGRTAVWEEHLIVGAVRAAVEALYSRVLERKSRVEPVPVTVAFFCAPEETHDLALRMLADRFDLRGFRTVYVGAATPVEEMVKCVQAMGATVVCLSASTHFQRAALHPVIEKLRSRLPGARILAGGPAFAVGSAGFEEHAVPSVEALLDELAGQTGAPGVAAAPATGAAGSGSAASGAAAALAADATPGAAREPADEGAAPAAASPSNERGPSQEPGDA